MKLKFGVDIHGVATDATEFFKEFTKTMVEVGYEVHIITGPPVDVARAEVEQLGISYTHIFSIADYHKEIGTPMTWDSNGHPFMSDYEWDRTKADYCQREEIHLHLDDSDAYGYFFKTPYARFYSKDKRKHYVKESEQTKNNKHVGEQGACRNKEKAE
jgi:hypothetical protein